MHGHGVRNRPQAAQRKRVLVCAQRGRGVGGD